MRTRACKTGFTLIEMVMVIAIIAILVSMVIGITKRIDDQSKERLCRETITLVGNALEQFRDFGYEYKSTDYAGLTFPLDCNNLSITAADPCLNLRDVLRNAIYPPAPSIVFVTITDAASNAITTEPPYYPRYSGSAALYFILSQVPDCRATLGKIDKSLLTNTCDDKVTDIFITIDITVSGVTTTTQLPFTRITDPWGTPLRYDYYPDYADYILAYPANTWNDYLAYRDSAKRTFPVITSAGPDKKFDTADDISSLK